MICDTKKAEIKILCQKIRDRINECHIRKFEGMENELFLISNQYPGVWMEHVFDSLVFSRFDKRGEELSENIVNLFLDNQTQSGQMPCYVLNRELWRHDIPIVGYSQIQECVSFATLCLEVCELNDNKMLLEKCYHALKKWIGWFEKYRMTRKTGLIEMFVGYDTGHDESSRLDGLSCKGNYEINGVVQNAGVLPPDDEVAPIIAVDMNCNYFADLNALSVMAKKLSLPEESEKWTSMAKRVKSLIFEYCFDEKDAFFYDVDKNGNKRKSRSCTVFHLFMEHLLDKNDDAELISQIKSRYLKNPDEFFTPYPYPSMSIAQSRQTPHAPSNCWGYYSQGLIALRCIRWMDDYGMSEEFDLLCEKWLCAWTDCFDEIKFGQELDPISGRPSSSSEWYSSTMLFYLYAAKRLSIDSCA